MTWMRWGMRWGSIGVVALSLALGCAGRELSDGDGGADDGDGSSDAGSGGGATTGQPAATSTSTVGTGDESGGGVTTAQPPPSTCADGSAFAATAELIDSGIGPEGSLVTVENCTEVQAWVYQDCCFGAAYRLERRNAPEDPWYVPPPALACDCSGPIEPLVIEPMSQIQFEASPSGLDADPICDVGAVEYRYLLSVTRSDSPDAWQDVPTTAFAWYCEG